MWRCEESDDCYRHEEVWDGAMTCRVMVCHCCHGMDYVWIRGIYPPGSLDSSIIGIGTSIRFLSYVGHAMLVIFYVSFPMPPSSFVYHVY